MTTRPPARVRSHGESSGEHTEGRELLSGRVLGMKFMQKGAETLLRNKLKTAQVRSKDHSAALRTGAKAHCVNVRGTADPDLLFRPGRRAFGGCNPVVEVRLAI